MRARPALAVARRLKSSPTVVDCGIGDILDNYPELVRAAEAPVTDTSCAGLLMLAREVHAQGFKVALTGEGADEWLAGYSWFKIHGLLNPLKLLPSGPVSDQARRMFFRVQGLPRLPRRLSRQYCAALEGDNAWLEFYGLVGTGRLLFFNPEMRELALREAPFETLQLNRERMRRWHPFNRSIYVGGRIMLPGHLLASKGDRVAMNSSVETRYPSSRRGRVDFTARLDPSWKMRGSCATNICCVGSRNDGCLHPWLGGARRCSWRRSTASTGRAPDALSGSIELLSAEMLSRTGYFDPAAVAFWRNASRRYRQGSFARMAIEIGLVGVVATQLWHHTFIDGVLADLPSLVGGGNTTAVNFD